MTNLKSYLRLAKNALNKKQYSKAIHFYNKHNLVDKKNADAWSNLGYAYYFSYKIQDAIRCFKISLSINKRDTFSWHYLGHCYQQQDNFKKASECFKHELKIDPYDAHSWNELGYSLFASPKNSTHKIKKAIKCYDRSLKIKSRNSEALANKGTALYNLDKLKEANNCYEKALRINPKDVYALHYNGHCLQELDRHKDAINSFKKQYKLDKKEYDDTIYQIGLSYFLSRDFETAKHYFVKSSKVNDKDVLVDTLVALVHTSRLLEQKNEVQKYLNKIVNLNRIKRIGLDNSQSHQEKRHKIGIKYYMKYKTILH